MNTVSSLLFENEEGYKKLFDNAHDLIHFAKPDGSLIYVNKSWMSILEYTQEEIEGKSLYSFIHEADREEFMNYRKNVLGGECTDRKVTITLNTKSGKLVKTEGFILVECRNDQPFYTTGIFRDVTKKLENEESIKQSNEQLRQSEFDLQQLLIHAPDAIIVIDRHGIIQFWNPKAEQIFGWTSADVMGKTLTNTIIPPQYREAHDSGMKRYLSTGEVHVLNKTIEITALNKEGKEFYVSLTISTTRQRGNTAFIAFIRDITVQKNSEAELENSKKALEISNRELEQFAHVASHDMKEPIRKIKLFAQRVTDDFGSSLPEDGRMFLEKVQSAANRLINMVEGVLSYSAITHAVEPFAAINLHQILKSIEEDLEVLIADKKATVTYGELPPFEGIPFLVYQLFYNLINNSLKFTMEGIHPVVNISGRLLHEDELPETSKKQTSYVEILVKDNGIGFHPNYTDKIFQTFTRLNPKDKYEGTGLGLALCKNIVSRHGGSIQAVGQPAEGASFIIRLPQQQGNPPLKSN